MKEWHDFLGEKWKETINVEDFILNNYKEYTGDDSFLVGPTEKTLKVWEKIEQLQKRGARKRNIRCRN